VHRLGILHSIPEQMFKCEHATIIDVGFSGLFPKAVLLVMHQYAKDIKKTSHEDDNTEFLSLMHQLIMAFMYRPIIIHRVIQLMITRKKQHIEQAWKEAHDAGANRGGVILVIMIIASSVQRILLIPIIQAQYKMTDIQIKPHPIP